MADPGRSGATFGLRLHFGSLSPLLFLLYCWPTSDLLLAHSGLISGDGERAVKDRTEAGETAPARLPPGAHSLTTQAFAHFCTQLLVAFPLACLLSFAVACSFCGSFCGSSCGSSSGSFSGSFSVGNGCVWLISCTERRSTTLRSHSSATHKHMPSRQGDTMYAHTAIGHLLRYKHTRNRTLVLSHEKVFSPSNRIAHKRKSNRTAVLLVF